MATIILLLGNKDVRNFDQRRHGHHQEEVDREWICGGAELLWGDRWVNQQAQGGNWLLRSALSPRLNTTRVVCPGYESCGLYPST